MIENNTVCIYKYTYIVVVYHSPCLTKDIQKTNTRNQFN